MIKNRWDTEKLVSMLVMGGIFVLIFLCNCLTPYMKDDFAYCYSFADGERIDSIIDIFPSMAAHAKEMNGRLVAHSLAQVTLMLPPWVFDIGNSIFFCMLIKMVSDSSGQKKDNWLIYMGVFCALWLLTPAFGQVMYWQDGAVNYMWAAVFGNLFLRPFIHSFMNDGSGKMEGKLWRQLGFLLLSFVAGAYLESTSIAVVCVAAMLVVLDAWMNHRKLNKFLTCAVLVAFFGYITIYLAPAQWMNKSGGNTSILDIVNSFIWIMFLSEPYLPLYILTAVLLTINIMKKSDTRKIVLAVVLFLGGMAANYIMAFAHSYPTRCALGTVVFHIAANVVLIEAISWEKEYRIRTTCVIVVLVMLTIPHLLAGMRSVGVTWKYMRINEQTIMECAENGIKHVEIPMIYPENKYSALYEGKYLDTEDPHTWPNRSMAKFYGVDTIIGIPQE